MSLPEFQRNFFQLFDLPAGFRVDVAQLGMRYRQLQVELHPDRYAGASAYEQRIAVQYSALINEAYAVLRKPLPRALYLLELTGMSQDDVAGHAVDGTFLMLQMELREKLEALFKEAEPESTLALLLADMYAEITAQQELFAHAYEAEDLPAAANACVKMQYLDKLLQEAEQLESRILER